jgi:hypothetical protein
MKFAVRTSLYVCGNIVIPFGLIIALRCLLPEVSFVSLIL